MLICLGSTILRPRLSHGTRMLLSHNSFFTFCHLRTSWSATIQSPRYFRNLSSTIVICCIASIAFRRARSLSLWTPICRVVSLFEELIHRVVVEVLLSDSLYAISFLYLFCKWRLMHRNSQSCTLLASIKEKARVRVYKLLALLLRASPLANHISWTCKRSRMSSPWSLVFTQWSLVTCMNLLTLFH